MNIAEILKDCPKETELYSPIFGKVFLSSVNNNEILVALQDGRIRVFNHNGQYKVKTLDEFHDAECMLFPSKEDRDWNNFVPPQQKHIFTPFEKVLVRNSTESTWIAALFSHINPDNTHEYKYITCGDNLWKQCIPFEGNEHLVGTN